jgi:hypothetical protein
MIMRYFSFTIALHFSEAKVLKIYGIVNGPRISFCF